MVARRGKKPMRSGKKRKLKDLRAKGVTSDKARQVKGGYIYQHNQTDFEFSK